MVELKVLVDNCRGEKEADILERSKEALQRAVPQCSHSRDKMRPQAAKSEKASTIHGALGCVPMGRADAITNASRISF